jgi:hypothetical protein
MAGRNMTGATGFFKSNFYLEAIAVQASAQRLQAAAHVLQCSISCLPHSAPQVWQILAQRAHTSLACASPRAIEAAANWQISAHAMSAAMHPAMGFGSFSFKQLVAHCRQATAHSWQARMQSVSFWLSILIP